MTVSLGLTTVFISSLIRRIKNKRLSSATVSKRLAYLLNAKTLEEVVTKSKSGRRVIAYRTTEKGRKVIMHAKELEESLALSKTK
jgi:DNA-binding PadR family transcriptional regulator